MNELLQTYGNWIFGAFFLLMMLFMHSGRGGHQHGSHGGCGMGHGSHHDDDTAYEESHRHEGPRQSQTTAGEDADPKPEEGSESKSKPAAPVSAGHGAGCH